MDYALPMLAGTAFVVGFSGAMMPGPMLSMVISEVPRVGPLTGAYAIAGHAVLEIATVGALVLGLGSVLKADAVLGAIGLVGGAVLAWMGWGMLRSARAVVEQSAAWLGASPARATSAGATPAESQALPQAAPTQRAIAGERRRGAVRVAARGVVTSASNPYYVLWWATTGALYVNLAVKHGAVGVACFFGGHILADLSWYMLVSVAATTGRRSLPAAAYRALIMCCGAFVIVMAAVFVYFGANKLIGA